MSVPGRTDVLSLKTQLIARSTMTGPPTFEMKRQFRKVPPRPIEPPYGSPPRFWMKGQSVKSPEGMTPTPALDESQVLSRKVHPVAVTGPEIAPTPWDAPLPSMTQLTSVAAPAI